MNSSTVIKKKSIDFGLLIVVLLLMMFGVIMVFSASYYDTITEMSNPYYYLLRVLLWFFAGLVLMFLITIIPYRVYYVLAPYVLVFCIGLLLLIWTPLGKEAGGAIRWLDFGFIAFMPSEIGKIGSIMFVAWYYTKFSKYTRTPIRGVIPVYLLAILFFLLIYLQPNLSTAIIMCGIIIGMMFVAGIKWKHFGGMLVVSGIGLAILLVSRGGFHMQRITSFLDPLADPQGASYQVIQSLLALAAGGVFGTGPGNSIQKAQYLPEAQNDFIFAIIGEEYGFIGCMLILIVYIILIWKGAMIAINAADKYGMMLASGVTILFALQVTMNVAVVTSLMPPTGVILPFISYGGSAMLVFAVAAGILLNVSRYKKVEVKESKKE